MILLPTVAQRIARIPFLFRAHECLDSTGLYALSYGQRVYAVHTRADVVAAEDQAGRLLRVPSGMPRLHQAASASGGLRALLLERATTNYLLYSQDYSNAAWSKTNVTVTTNAIAAPDGTMTADKIEATASAATLMRQVVTTIASTQATYAVYVRQGSGATEANKFAIYNDTTATTIANVTINYATGAVTASSGVARAVQLGSTPWWRLEITALTGITSGNDLACYPCFTGAAETAGEYAYIWQADLTPDATASSPIPTTGATDGRVADELYFPLLLTPRVLTLYARGVEQLRADAAASSDSAVCYIGAAGGSTAARLATYRTTAEAGYRALHDPAVATVASAVGAAAQRGDLVEVAALLASTGSVRARAAINAGTEETSAASTAQALAAAWSAYRIYLNSFGTGSTGGFAFTHAAVLEAAPDTSEIRDLCEVG